MEIPLSFSSNEDVSYNLVEKRELPEVGHTILVDISDSRYPEHGSWQEDLSVMGPLDAEEEDLKLEIEEAVKKLKEENPQYVVTYRGLYA